MQTICPFKFILGAEPRSRGPHLCLLRCVRWILFLESSCLCHCPEMGTAVTPTRLQTMSLSAPWGQRNCNEMWQISLGTNDISQEAQQPAWMVLCFQRLQRSRANGCRQGRSPQGGTEECAILAGIWKVLLHQLDASVDIIWLLTLHN